MQLSNKIVNDRVCLNINHYYIYECIEEHARMYVCCVSGCRANDKTNKEQCSFFRFPLEIIRCTKWQQLPFLKKSKHFSVEECYKRLRVCSNHFTEDHFSSMQRNRLKRTAIPNIFPEIPASIPRGNEQNMLEFTAQPCHQRYKMDPISESTFQPASHDVTDWERETTVTVADVASQTDDELSHHTPRKMALENTIKGLKRKINFSESAPPKRAKMEFMEFMQENYSSIATFINTEIEVMGRALKEARYSSELKQFAPTTYFMRPAVYKFLHPTYPLPGNSTLLRITRKWEVGAGFSNFVCDVIKLKTDLEENAKDCTLYIKEMSLKTFLYYHMGIDEIIAFHHTVNEKEASNVLTLKDRCLSSDWKQPLAYFLLNLACHFDLNIKKS